MHQYILSEQAKISVESSGSGKLLMLLHAGIADKRMWLNEVDYLSKQFQVINIDLPGFGKSDILGKDIDYTAVIKSVIYYFQLSEVTILAASFGAKIAIDYTLLYPKDVSKLVVVSPALSGWKNSVELDDYEQKEETVETVEETIALMIQFWISRNLPSENLSAKTTDLLTDMLENILAKETDHVEEVNSVDNSLLLLSQLNLPVLIINGANDVSDFLEIGVHMQKSVATSEQVVIPSATHLPNLNHPALFKEVLIRFLSETRNI